MKHPFLLSLAVLLACGSPSVLRAQSVADAERQVADSAAAIRVEQAGADSLLLSADCQRPLADSSIISLPIATEAFSPFSRPLFPLAATGLGLYDWRLHEGFNAQLGMDVTVAFGKNAPSGAGFGQHMAMAYALPLSKRFTAAIGIYGNNFDWGSSSQREAGIAATIGYRVNDAINVYAYGSKTFFSSGTFGLRGMYPPLYRFPSERIGAMAEFKIGENASIHISVEHQSYDVPKPH